MNVSFFQNGITFSYEYLKLSLNQVCIFVKPNESLQMPVTDALLLSANITEYVFRGGIPLGLFLMHSVGEC